MSCCEAGSSYAQYTRFDHPFPGEVAHSTLPLICAHIKSVLVTLRNASFCERQHSDDILLVHVLKMQCDILQCWLSENQLGTLGSQIAGCASCSLHVQGEHAFTCMVWVLFSSRPCNCTWFRVCHLVCSHPQMLLSVSMFYFWYCPRLGALPNSWCVHCPIWFRHPILNGVALHKFALRLIY